MRLRSEQKEAHGFNGGCQPTGCCGVLHDRLPMYGMPTWGDAFADRQLVALTTFSDLVAKARTMLRMTQKTQV